MRVQLSALKHDFNPPPHYFEDKIPQSLIYTMIYFKTSIEQQLAIILSST